MSFNQVPMTLPEDYSSVWAEPNKKRSNQASVTEDNPFSDNYEQSRVTASGFTQTTMDQARHNEILTRQRLLELQLETSKKVDQNISIAPLIGNRKERNLGKKERDESLKLSDEIRMMAEMSLEKSRRVTEERLNLVKSQDDAWEEEKREKEKYVTMQDFTNFAQMVAKSVHPMDSASVDPREREFLRRTTATSSKLSGILEMESDIEGTVIGGFELTASEKMREIDAFSNMPKVRGLPAVYTNDRLNFLSHLHSALFKIASDDSGVYPGEGCLGRLLDSRKGWGSDPETTLLKLVLDRTIDTETSEIIANPFRLPILEPGMYLTSQVMYMCLDQLHNEFEREFFDTTKTMVTPKFSSKYENRKYRRDTARRRSSSKAVLSSSSSSAGNSRRSTVSRRSSGEDGLSSITRFLRG